jgi:hypothetical protein
MAGDAVAPPERCRAEASAYIQTFGSDCPNGGFASATKVEKD